MRRLVSLFVAVVCVLSLAAQKDFHFENFTTREGLSHNEVRALLRDSRGYLWAGTANGLNRFDGYSFKVYLPGSQNGNSISGEAIASLAEAPDGRIWIAHNHGLDIYDPARDTFLNVRPRPEDENAWSFGANCRIAIGQQGQAVITNNAEYVLWFPPGSFLYEHLATPDIPLEQRPKNVTKYPLNILLSVAAKSSNEVWVSSFFGAFSLDLVSKSFTYYPLKGVDWEFGPGPICYDEGQQMLWFTVFGQGLFSYSLKDGMAKYRGNVPIGFINSGPDVALLAGGKVWANFPGVLDPNTEAVAKVGHIPDDPYSFPNASVIVAYSDQDGILWVGTTGGLVKMDPLLQGFHYVQIDGHPPYDYDNSVYEIFENPEDGLYYITSFYVGRIYLYDPRTGRSRDINDEFHPAIKSSPTRIFRDSKGITWLLADGLIYRANLAGRRLQPIPMPPPPKGISNRAIFDIEEDAEGDLWIAKWRSGLLRYNRKSGEITYAVPPEGMLNPGSVGSLAASRDRKTIWLGTRNEGLFSIDITTGQWKHFVEFDVNGKAVSVIGASGIEVDPENNLWVATQRGLLRYSPNGDVRAFTHDDGLENSYLEGMNQDHQGRLWLATGKGISCVDSKTLAIRNFDERNGLKADATLDGFSVNSKGEVFSGTKRGFIWFNPDNLLTDNRPPKLVLSSFKVAGQERFEGGLSADYWKEVRLKPSENFFSIEYAALNFTLPEENTYYYKLENLYEDWVDAGKQRVANFTKLPPGRYVFCLKARNKDGVWSTAERKLAIIVAPPLWRTWWFISLLAALVLGMVYGMYRLRAAQIRREEQMKTSFNKKLAEVEMAALRSQMNPHFLFNCLNSINRFIQRNEPDAASAYLTKFSRLIRLVLDNSRSDQVSLRDEMEALRLYVELEAMRFVGRFTYKIDVAPGLDTSSIELPPMLVQPYVENAIWHGLMHKEKGDCQLWVRAFERGGRLIVEVEDNGIGREMARLLKSKSATLHKSHGMKVTAERIGIINEIYEAKAEVQIDDLKDEAGKPAGTKVTLSLPLD
ncbi:MAG: histidine kinase [Phaeodactylibacter sp.]|nr:histidine kinase [Phaeodactylibacter sp.]MCB9273362.1 histidine kinase [Lewinellaceae bacterium]